MSCQLKAVAKLENISSIKKLLFPSYDLDDPDEWNWPDELEEDVNDNSVNLNLKEQNWLYNCNISLSSSGDVLAISNRTRIVILKSKWDSQAEGDVKTIFVITCSKDLCDEDEEISAVLCMPLISLGKISHGIRDWTCIAVGFSSGFLRLYTEDLELLAEELLHSEPVKSLKCQSHHVGRFNISEKHVEEVYVIYQTVVCILQGFALFQTLRQCRKQLTLDRAFSENVHHSPPLLYKKWGFRDQYLVADCEVMGLTTSKKFDHLMTASLDGGFNAYCRSSPPQNSLVIGTGQKPFIGFHYIIEGASQPVLADVTKAVASALKSAIGQAIPVWLSGGKATNSQEKAKPRVAVIAEEKMVCSFGLSDPLRNGEKLVLSPNKNLSVVTDSFGRITLIDNHKGIAIRMWKGYRESQCGWLEVKEEVKLRSGVTHPRMSLFLVIFSAKKSIIEIWAMAQGPRVATFKVNKNGRLLYTSYGFMGLNMNPSDSGNKSQFPCVFLDPNGFLTEIIVPFHFSLSDKNSKRARDLHLLKKLKKFLKEVDCNNEQLIEEVQKTMQELKTNEIKLQTVEILIASKFSIPEALEVALNDCLNKLSDQDFESLDHAGKLLLQMTQRLQKLVTFYQYVQKQRSKPPAYNKVVAGHQNSPQVLSGLLNAPEREVNSLLSLLATINTVDAQSRSQPIAKVSFLDDGRAAFVDFLSCFEIDIPVIPANAEMKFLCLKKNLPEDKLKCISELIFQGALYDDSTIDCWQIAANQSHIQPLNLMQLALIFWLQKREGASLEAEMLQFMDLIKAICSLADINTICVEANEISPWWKEVRDILTQSTNPFMALIASILCRAVALTLEQMKELRTHQRYNKKVDNQGNNENDNACCQDMSFTPEDEMQSSTTSEWENVSRDTCQWSLLIGQLEDVALLEAILRQQPLKTGNSGTNTLTGKELFCLPFEKPSVSLGIILKHGKGSVSELVARWLCSSGVEAEKLVDAADKESDMEQEDTATALVSNEDNLSRRERILSDPVREGDPVQADVGAEAAAVDEKQLRILEYLGILKHRFPYSLSSSRLLANLCWEYVLAWKKNFDDLEGLQAAISCLNCIPSSQIKRGICNLVWTTHLKQRFESAAKLINKAEKVPNERLCYQEVGISDLQMASFLGLCIEFLDIFMCAALSSTGTNSCNQLRYEELWDYTAGPLSIAQLALSQPPTNLNLLYLHHQLATALHMMMSFAIRVQTPIETLFNGMGQAALFSDLSSNPQMPIHSPKLVSNRTQFLLRVVSNALHTIQTADDWEDCKAGCSIKLSRYGGYVSGNEQGDVLFQDTNNTNLETCMAFSWMSKCYDLATVWGVNCDDLRRHQVCVLYAKGFDRLAEEIVPAVNDFDKLTSQLLVIVGQRLQKLIMSSSKFGDHMSRLSPQVSNWLESLSSSSLQEVVTTPPGDTAQLLSLAMQHMLDSHRDYKLALQLIDFVQDLANVAT